MTFRHPFSITESAMRVIPRARSARGICRVDTTGSLPLAALGVGMTMPPRFEKGWGRS
jgi:hypothetical protein